MEKSYIYRKHLREPAKFFLAMVMIVLIGYVIGVTLVISNIHGIDITRIAIVISVIGVVFVGFISLEFLIIYFIMYRRFKKIKMTLTEEGIIYINTKGETIIAYEDIKDIKLPSIKYTGGWLKIIHSTGNIRLTVVLENIGDLVKSLKNKLDEKNMSQIYDEKAMYKFLKTAEYSDQSWERIYGKAKFFIFYIVINLAIAVFASTFINQFLVRDGLIIVAYFGPFMLYLISEIILIRKLAKGASRIEFSVPERDKSFENRIYKWAFGIYTIVYVIVLIKVLWL